MSKAPSIYLAFSDNGEHIRFWTASEDHAREWARENWETEPFFSGEQMAAVLAENERLREDARRLDFLDGNARMKMGWYVGAAPAGNLLVSSVIQPNGQTSIRAAIDAAMPANAGIEAPL